MRSALLAAATFALVLSGCTSPASNADFAALAMKAPDLLEQDMGADGKLRSMEGSMKMAMHMTMDGQDMHVTMDMDMTQTLYAGGAMLMTMAMQGSGQGMSMDMTMHMFCSPDRLVIRSEGMPSGEDLDMQADNAAGHCDGPEAFAGLADEMDPQVRSQFESMMKQGSMGQLTYAGTKTVGGTQYALYKTDMDLGTAVPGMDFSMETRGALGSDGRLSKILITASGSMDQDAGDSKMHMDMTMDGAFDLVYGAREPVPAEWASA